MNATLRRDRSLTILLALSFPALMIAGSPQTAAPQPRVTSGAVSDEGIPVTDPDVISACGSCTCLGPGTCVATPCGSESRRPEA